MFMYCFKELGLNMIALESECLISLAKPVTCAFVFQLLMPHIRSTLQINIQARATLLATKGVFDKVGVFIIYCLLCEGSEREI